MFSKFARPRAVRAASSASALFALAAMLAACGDGGSSGPAPGVPSIAPPKTPQGTQSLGVTFAGTQTLARVRRAQDLAATPVTVSLNGTVIGTGTLDGNGHAKITFTVPVAPGSTVTVVAGRLTVTATLATTAPNTALLVTVNADGTISVNSAADASGSGVVEPGDAEQENATEDDHGNVTSITGGGNALPANAPFTLTRTCTTLTLTPAGAAAAFIKFEEKGSDGESDDAGRVKFEGAFTGPLTFPISSASARVHIEIFDAQHHRLIEVKAPITAFTSGTGTPTSPCPSPSPTAGASADPSASPEPSESPEHSPSPEPSASPAPQASPTAAPTASASPAPR